MRFPFFHARPVPPGVIRERILFRGRVQHIGFRFEMQNLARNAGVTGTCINMDDGTVTAELQGTRDQIDGVVEGMYAIPRIVITGIDCERIPPVAGERGFRTGGV